MATLALLAACGGSKKPTAATTSTPPPSITTTTAAPAPVFPLTGLPTNGSPNAARPALSVKIDNVEGSFPQAGINSADIVYELLVEGGQTRLMAVFQSQDADPVGPIRSARPADADVLHALGGGIFAYSGAAPGEIAPVEDHSNATLLSFDSGNPAFHRDKSRPAPHNVFSSTPALYSAGADAGDHSNAPPAQFTYGPPNPGLPITNAAMTLGIRASASWAYDGGSQQYQRTQNGKPDIQGDGNQITADNVVIMTTDIGPTGVFDVNGEEDPLVVVIGQGTAWVMRDGQLSQGTWSRPNEDSPTTFKDAQGNVMTLKPGRTWVEFLPSSEPAPTFS